jgi:chromosome partitioning protein
MCGYLRPGLMGLVYAIANQKGGVGKTTTAVNVAACFAADGRQVLLVDLDQQCNATVALGADRDLRPSSYDCLCGATSVAEAARPAGPDNLWLVPANRDLAGASVELPRLEHLERRLRDGLGPVRDRFALTLLDCPPSLGPVTVNALAAADRVIVPVQAEYLALEGLVQFMETLDLMRRDLNPALVLTGVVVTMHDERTRLGREVEAELRRHFPEQVFDTVIPRSVRVAEAPSFGLPVTAHAPGSRGAAAFRALVRELAERETDELLTVRRVADAPATPGPEPQVEAEPVEEVRSHG